MRRWALIAGLGLALAPQAGEAAGNLTVSPAIEQVNIQPSQAQTITSIKVTNSSSQERQLSLQAVDFGTLDDTGGVYFAGAQDNFASKYGLTKWATIGESQIDLKPGESHLVQIQINNDSTLAPGGHYGAILFKDAQPLSQKAQIGLRPVLTELLFVRKLGGDHPDLSFDSLLTQNSWWGIPDDLTMRFTNNGNVHVVPRGIVKVFDPKGRQVRTGTINEDSNLVLPEAKRLFDVPLTSLGNAWLPGNYKVQVLYRFDGNQNYSVAERGITILNLQLIGAVVAVVVLAAMGLSVVWLRMAKRRRR